MRRIGHLIFSIFPRGAASGLAAASHRSPASAALLVLLASGARAGAAEIQLEDPGSTVHGKTLPEWSAEWWRWACSFPRTGSPLLDETGELCWTGESGPVFFLAGVRRADSAQFIEVLRSCEIPEWKSIFFPVVSRVGVDRDGGTPPACDDVCGEAKQEIDRAGHLFCSVDGRILEDLRDRRERSTCFDLILPADNVENLPAGTYSPACSDGCWAMLKPLSPGPHIIRIEGTLGGPSFSLTYLIEVRRARFRRGDANGDGVADLTDAVAILGCLFLAGDRPVCEDAADTQDDGAMDLSDAVSLLQFLFQGGVAPPSPGPKECGEDPTEDELRGCSGRANC